MSHGPALWTGEKRSVPAITPDEHPQTPERTPEPEPVTAPETGTEVTVDEPKEPALAASSTKGRSKTGG